ncbi:MAG TPA: type II toxin-antitoxin system VapC family toxin, partial [Thermoanaerobaculia bacterium]|nr:type II toxin-antitoxin system VapC family toxin [Thermoanaerobaculia bacterium]
DRGLLSARARAAMSGDVVALSPLTFWELAMLARKGRIALDAPPQVWLRDALDRSGTVTLDLSLEIATLAGTLPNDQMRDPADRIIAATAIHHRIALVTKDERIRESGVVPTIW